MNKASIVAAILALAGCKGADGRPGTDGVPGANGRPGDGHPCWDIDDDGVCAPTEDVNGSGGCDVGDCFGGQGPAGPDGPVGAVGPAGPAGLTGVQGAQGAVGRDGLRGPQGPIGPAGVQGAQGVVGAAGAAGPAGPRASLIADYEFEEDPGATVFADSSGLASSLSASPGGVNAGSATAHSGKSITFTGGQGLVAAVGNRIPDSAQVWPELWIRTGAPNATSTLLDKVGAYRLRLAAGHLEWTVFTTNGPCTVTHTAALAVDTWTHVSGLYDGLTAAVEIDGAARSTPCRAGRIAPSYGSLTTLGGKLSGAVWSEVFLGNIDEVRIRASTDFTVGRVAGGCPAGAAITAITDGNVICGAASEHRVIRYNVFDTYLENCCWVADNNPSLFGGVNPSTWTDGNGMASDMSADAETLRTLFNQKLYPGTNAVVSSERWRDASSTNGKVTVALLRIKNTNGGSIDWTPSFYFTAYAGWGERASVALNGGNVWNSDGDYGSNSTASVTLSIPGHQTSTVIWVVPSSPPWNAGANGDQYHRMTMLAFYANSLELPSGLAFVDDLDSLSGNAW